MLCLTRKKREIVDVFVGSVHVELTVIDIRNGQVRLGISGPEGARVLRREITLAISQEMTSEAKVASAP